MRKLSIKILILIVGVAFLIPIIPVKETKAQWVVELGPASASVLAGILAASTTTAGASTATAAATATTAVATTNTSLATGVIGTGAATIATLRAGLGAPCEVIIRTYDTSTIVGTVLQTTAGSALEAIGGGAVEYGSVTAKIAKATAAKACVDAYLVALSAPILTANQAQAFAPEQDKFTKVSNSLRTTIETLTAQQSASVKDILKAFMVKVILNLNKSLTTELVNKMVQKYKISDYLAYGDALATQVYSMKYIADNFDGDTEKQLMVRSLLQSEKIPGKVKTVQAMANSQAQTYIGEACKVATPQADQDEMYFINCLAALGSPRANSNYHIDQALDGANAAAGSGRENAAKEISQSNGYAPPRNCNGSIAQQKQIDDQVDKAASDLDVAKLVKKKLVDSKASESEIAKADAAIAQAQANYNTLFAQLKASGGSISDTGKAKSGAIIDICESIASPANFVATSLGDFLKQHIDQGSKLESSNLPFYATFLADLTSNFLTNILTGNKSTTQVLKETGAAALNGTLIGLATQANGSGSGNGGGTGGGTVVTGTGDVNIYARLNTDNVKTTSLLTNKPYVLVVDFKDLIATAANNKDPVFNPYRVVITGANFIGSGAFQLSAAELAAGNVAFDFTPTTITPFTIKAQFYAKPTNGAVGDVPLNTNGGWTQAFTVSAVAGATTITPSVSFTPRGLVPALR